ncbi:8995_t:CDS:2, partial [Dentiscutata erythropus]
MNRLLLFTFIFLTLSFITTSSQEEVPYNLIYSLPPEIKKVGDDKLIVQVKWEGVNIKDDEPVTKRFRCFSKAVAVKEPHQKNGTFGERNTKFELTVKKKNVDVKCQYG